MTDQDKSVSLLRNQKASHKGLHFYRMMALIGATTCVLFMVVFWLIWDDGVELIWDRIGILLLSVGIYLLTTSTSNKKLTYGAGNFLFYSFTIHILATNLINDFSSEYFISLILTMQAVAVAFRTEKQTFVYLLFLILLCGIGMIIFTEVNVNEALFILGTLILSAGMLFAIVKAKAVFQRSMNLRQEILGALLDKTETAVFLTDFYGDIYECNSRAEELFQTNIENVKGMNFSEFRVKELTIEEDSKGVEDLLENRFWNNEIELKTVHGNCFYALVSITLIKRSNYEYLVYRITDRTSDIAQKNQLIQAKESAEKAVKVKSEFLATMSHEIRTPMNGVLGMTQLLDDTTLNDEQKGFVDVIRQSGKNLLVIINDILDLSKLESNKLILESREFNIHQSVHNSTSVLITKAQSKGLDLQVHIEKNVPKFVIGDSTRLEQILINLLSNAVKFTASGSVWLKVQLIDNTRSTLLQFSIKDSGIGIPKYKIKDLFESFAQLDSSTTRKYGGTGLGLAICKKLCDLMNGTISVKSQEDEGSTFYVHIPFDKSIHERKYEENKEEWTSEMANGSKVLVAEDNIVNQQVAKLILEGLGFDVILADNGEQAVQQWKNDRHPLVFMDLQMPVKDGLQAAAEILEACNSSGVGIIAMTANVQKRDKDRCKNIGMIDFVSKPIEIKELKRKLVRCKHLFHQNQ